MSKPILSVTEFEALGGSFGADAAGDTEALMNYPVGGQPNHWHSGTIYVFAELCGARAEAVFINRGPTAKHYAGRIEFRDSDEFRRLKEDALAAWCQRSDAWSRINRASKVFTTKTVHSLSKRAFEDLVYQHTGLTSRDDPNCRWSMSDDSDLLDGGYANGHTFEFDIDGNSVGFMARWTEDQTMHKDVEYALHRLVEQGVLPAGTWQIEYSW